MAAGERGEEGSQGVKDELRGDWKATKGSAGMGGGRSRQGRVVTGRGGDTSASSPTRMSSGQGVNWTNTAGDAGRRRGDWENPDVATCDSYGLSPKFSLFSHIAGASFQLSTSCCRGGNSWSTRHSLLPPPMPGESVRRWRRVERARTCTETRCLWVVVLHATPRVVVIRYRQVRLSSRWHRRRPVLGQTRPLLIVLKH